MDETLRCLRCDVPLEEGYAVDHAHGYLWTMLPRWFPGRPERKAQDSVSVGGKGYRAIARVYHCPNCGRLEFYTGHYPSA